jgi:tetratricopeptide (TPR) repeat protein
MTFEAALASHKSGDIAAAETAYREIVARTEHADALCNLGLILKARGDYAEAEAMLRRAVAAAPQNRVPVYNLGNLYQQLRRLDEAVPCFRTAIDLGAGAPAQLNLGNALLALGRYDEGWPLYDARPEHANNQANKLGFPEWRGEPLAGKRLFIWPEQGFGDQILAARFIPLLEAAEVTFVCGPELAELFAQLPATIVPRRGDISVPPHDYWSIPLSLPRWIGRIPQDPYLTAQPRPTGGRIGVAWSGNALPDPLRSLDAAAAERLKRMPGAVSLHPQDTGARGFRETAELVAGLDLVVTIDTSVAHLAGALGKPTIVLLQHYSSDWRWREAEDGSAFWYPTAKVLRQPKPGDWASVLDDLEHELKLQDV